jgi:uncharacterized iron-regulated protein
METQLSDKHQQQKQWLKLRLELFRQVKSQVDLRLGPQAADYHEYQRVYDQEFRRPWKKSSKTKLVEAVRNHDVILIGDFHALNQSQRTQLRLIQSIHAKMPIVLAVEFIEHRHQAELDAFFRREISSSELCTRVDWQGRWGFPPESFCRLLEWARTYRVPIYGINKFYKLRNAATLNKRDEFAAGCLARIRRSHPQEKIVAIFGDYHLARPHLPAAILRASPPGAKRPRIMRVFQNSENLFFKLAKLNLESRVDVIQLTGSDFCLNSVAPWVKWQSYLIFLERLYDSELYEDAEGIDYTDLVVGYIRLLSKDLGLKVGCDRLSVFTAGDRDWLRKVSTKLSDREVRQFQKMVTQETSFYIPQLQWGYLARPTVNHASMLAADYIHSQVSGRRELYWQMPHDFTRQIWLYAVTYFGSKLVNPKRRIDTLTDLKNSLAIGASAETERDPLLVALNQKMLEMMALAGVRRARAPFVPRHKSSYFEAARLLGGLMGEKWYNGVRGQKLPTSTLRSLLRKSLAPDDFESFYMKVVALAENFPMFFKSKKEKL